MNPPTVMVCVRIEALPQCFVYHFAKDDSESPSLQRRASSGSLFAIGQRCTVAEIVADLFAAKAGVA